jgi:hypothetical protein
VSKWVATPTAELLSTWKAPSPRLDRVRRRQAPLPQGKREKCGGKFSARVCLLLPSPLDGTRGEGAASIGPLDFLEVHDVGLPSVCAKLRSRSGQLEVRLRKPGPEEEAVGDDDDGDEIE